MLRDTSRARDIYLREELQCQAQQPEMSSMYVSVWGLMEPVTFADVICSNPMAFVDLIDSRRM